MRHFKCILFILLLAFSSSRAWAELHDGMLFRSYDVSADQRTSMLVSDTQGDPLVFSDSLSISFSLKLELNKGRFGYICRLALDDLLPIDLLLSPESGNAQLCATADHRSIVAIDWAAEQLGEWNDIYIKLAGRGDSLLLSINRVPVYTIFSPARRHRVKAFFGKVDASGMRTSDVAPMMVADLHVALDRNRTASWSLCDSSDMAPRSGISVSYSNQVFLRDINRKWTSVWESSLPAKSYATVSRDFSTIFFVSDGQIAESDVASARTFVYPCSVDMNMQMVTGEFLSAEGGSLAYADMETGTLIGYDRQTHEWESPNGKSKMSVHLHHNTVYLDSLAIQLFGYGQHRYSNELYVWNVPAGTVTSRVLDQVAPRYLAAAGVYGGKIYVLGGKGNESGLQGLGARIYDDLIEIDPSDWSSRVLWHSDAMSGLVPAHDLVFEQGGRSFLALVYNPEVNDSRLQLMRFDMSDGSAQPLADPIPYRFSDVSSNVRFFYNEVYDVFFAAVSSMDAGTNKSEIFLLGSPVLTDESEDDGHGLLLPVALLLLFALIGLAVYLHFRKGNSAASMQSSEAEPAVSAVTALPEPGIQLLGSFKVINREGTDISASFSPILIQLLSVLEIFTEERGGVTNSMLKSLLWADKSDESFNNNKGVYVRKLRTLLSTVGDISIVVEGGVWSIRDLSGLCDYPKARRMLAESGSEKILKAAMCGPLLPEYHFDWLDPFKAAYADLALSRLAEVSSSSTSAELLVKVADAQMKFDSLDEDAVLMKCQALIAMGKTGTAKMVFSHFTEEYSAVMGESFSKDFTSFLKN